MSLDLQHPKTLPKEFTEDSFASKTATTSIQRPTPTTLDSWLFHKQQQPENLQMRVASSRRMQYLICLSESPPLSRQKDSSPQQTQSEYKPILEPSKPNKHPQSEMVSTATDETTVSVLTEHKPCLCTKLKVEGNSGERILCSCAQPQRLNKVRRLGIWLPDLDSMGANMYEPVFKYYFCTQTGLPAFVLPSSPHASVDDPRRCHHLSAADLLKIHPEWVIRAIESIDRYLAFLLLQTPQQLGRLPNPKVLPTNPPTST